MKFHSFSSSSSGNAYLYEFENVKLLVDVGISYTNLKEHLKDINLSFAEIDAILITHEHGDHVKGLEVLLKNEDLDVYTTVGTSKGLKFELNSHQEISGGNPFSINDLNVTPLSTSHDANESICFVFIEGDRKYGHITDTGYINANIQDNFSNLDFYLVESNYDERALLTNDDYPFPVKKRINSDKGHLSNVQASDFISKVCGDKTKVICFGHLSENNNDHELVEILNEQVLVDSKYILKKDERMEIICK